MRKYLLMLLLCAGLGSMSIIPASADQTQLDIQNLIVQQTPNETLTNIVYSDYVVDLDNLYKYNIIALQDADINCHIRGSIWVGGTLTGNQYIDDGSLNGKIASESYIFNNQSNIYFQSRTNNQGLDSYKGLTASAVENSINYWTSIINQLPQDNVTFIYVRPDQNGFVDLKKWDYQSFGSDETKQQIAKVYWTNATKVQMGGLAGHLIAPYADIHIVSCNHRGSIVGWNIYTDGESHINYWTPDLKGDTIETETAKTTQKMSQQQTSETEKNTETTKTTQRVTEEKEIKPQHREKETQKEKPVPPVIDEKNIPPKTGDNANLIFFFSLLILSFLCIEVIILIIKKKKSLK